MARPSSTWLSSVDTVARAPSLVRTPGAHLTVFDPPHERAGALALSVQGVRPVSQPAGRRPSEITGPVRGAREPFVQLAGQE